MKYTNDENEVEGTVKHAQFSLNGHMFMAMDSSLNHSFTFNDSVSIVVECETQDEIDYYWERFTAEGEESNCGWLKDKYGVSWQIIPAILKELMNDPSRAENVTNAFMKMKKMEIDKLVTA